MKIKLFLIISLFFVQNYFAQDSTKSEAFKENFKRNLYPLIKPKYISYPLMSSYILQRKSNEGDPFAQHELGLRYLLGKGFKPDTIKAVQLINKAAERNIASAKYNNGILFLNGIGVDWNPFAAFENIKFAAESGMPEAQYVMGIFYTDDLIVIRDLNKAKSWFKKSAKNDFEPAKKALQDLQSNGLDFATVSTTDSSQHNNYEFQSEYQIELLNLNQNNESEIDSVIKIFSEADLEKIKKILGIQVYQSKDSSNIALLNYACQQGSPEALLLKGKLEETGNNRQHALINSAEAYVKSFRLGSLKALEELMRLVKRDDFFRIVKKQIDNQNPKAMFVWASLIALGLDFQLTPTQAFELLQKAAKLNHTNSLIEIGLCYYNGNLVEKDISKAISTWKDAAKMGSQEAAVRNAFIIVQNSSSLAEKKENVKILVDASNSGSVLAQTFLAYCYEKGIGIRQQKSEAERLYRIAAKRGNQTAYNSLKRMYDELRPSNEDFKLY